ncbi:hypothetical protein [Alloalcanivorax xenomutans]|uniref:hypothetical protein n=1 Tax=Alloalcanivorax xenomutans TaxID=1094342 RepID=UPI001268572D
MKAKIIMLSALGVASFGLTQAASAGWDSGACPQPHTGPAPCIEHYDASTGTTTHFNGSGSHAGDWHGNPATGAPFTFKGRTNLTCGFASVECDLALDGKVRKVYDTANNTWKVGIEVSNATVDNGTFCGAVTVGGFEWYMNEDAPHPLPPKYNDDNDVGIPYDINATPPITMQAIIGPIDVSVPILGINVSNGHMHNVTYDNTNTFSFGTDWRDPVIYDENDDPTNCEVSGDLELEDTGDTLTIY